MKKTFIPTFFLLCSAITSQAAVILYNNQEVSIPAAFEGVYIDLETGDTGAAAFLGADINFFFGGEGIGNDASLASVTTPSLQFSRSGTNFLDSAVSSNAGDLLGVNTIIVSSGFGGSGAPNDHIGVGPTQFGDGIRSYLGFTLDIEGDTHYGYVDVTLTDNSAGGVVHGWAYEDQPDTSITITAIPEPSSGLLLMLSLAVIGMRRCRQ